MTHNADVHLLTHITVVVSHQNEQFHSYTIQIPNRVEIDSISNKKYLFMA